MSYEVWTGTPHEMAKAADKPSLPTAAKWASTYLTEMEKLAGKYDHAALASIRSTREQIAQVWTIHEGDRRSWEFPYVALTFRIELRRTK